PVAAPGRRELGAGARWAAARSAAAREHARARRRVAARGAAGAAHRAARSRAAVARPGEAAHAARALVVPAARARGDLESTRDGARRRAVAGGRRGTVRVGAAR